MTVLQAVDEMMMGYAAGGLSEPLSLVAATQASLDPACRRRVSDYEAIGGALLDELSPAEMSVDALEDVLDRLDDEPQAAEPAVPEVRDGHRLPLALRSYVGPDLEALSWRPVMRGLQDTTLPLPGPSRTRFLRIAPGVAVPRHSHHGVELTLVLEGAYRDNGDVYRRGDLQLADETVDHRPQVVGDETCLCLVVTEAPIRLTGAVGRFFNPFVKY